MDSLPFYSLSLDGLNLCAKIEWEKIHLSSLYLPSLVEDIHSKVDLSKPIIIPFSGGKDSTAALMLFTQYFSHSDIRPFILTSSSLGEDEDLSSVRRFPSTSIIKKIDISAAVQTYLSLSSRTDPWFAFDAPPIVRKITLENIARESGGTIIDTMNRTEFCLAFYSENSEWSPDVKVYEPWLDLYATEVLQVGKMLNVPPEILYRKQWTSETNTDKETVAGPFSVLDPILWRHIDLEKPLETISLELGHSLDYLRRLDQTRISGQAKRTGWNKEQILQSSTLLPNVIHALHKAREGYFTP